MAKLSRRGVFALGGGFAAVAAASLVLARGSPGQIAADIVRARLPGVRLDEAGVAKFMEDETTLHTGQWSAKVRLSVLAATRPLAIPFAPLSRRLEELERHTLTRFLTGSDFFYVDPSIDVVTYTGHNAIACPNPFATTV